MSKRFFVLLAAFAILPFGAFAEDEATPAEKPAEAQKYLLRYKFKAGETVYWDVEHRAQIRTTISGTTQTAETITKSTKIWKVLDVNKKGEARFEHSVSHIDMRQLLSGRAEQHYNSDADASPSPAFAEVAKAADRPLSVITLDAQGAVKDREIKYSQPNENQGQITIPLPDDKVAVGESWSFPYEIELTAPNKSGVKKVSTRQKFTLQDVRDGVAYIKVATQILTPISDPAIEAQLIQRQSDGEVRFDIAAGRVIGQQTDLDKSVVGFQGDASSMHYVMRFVERLSDEKPASKPKKAVAGPAPPPKSTKQAKKQGGPTFKR